MKGQRLRESLMRAVFMVSALASILAVALICLFLFAGGIPAIGKIGLPEFILGREWSPSDTPPAFGILPMILGSIYVTAGAVAIGVPVGIFTAVFMARICPRPLYKVLKPSVDLLAGIPSVIYGFFGLVTIVPLVRKLFGGNGSSILAASVLLGLMILPTVIGITESAIRAVPEELYDGAVALGANHQRAVFRVLLPAAKSGVLAGVVLGIGRAIGETMAVIMVAGNQARMPAGILKGIRTLTANIVIEMGYAEGLHREALIATGVVLFVFILIINLSFSALRGRGEK
ncbi:MAG: phosphate ABC transporter permease subunit PstC [Oscillibacter sp.]|nr:phosphate ABC transporter permease subunit PstC [Oscillibacter sp.]MEA4994584.1 phosphate ABC transporter permease subunit PstC [Oscillibacter sp.]